MNLGGDFIPFDYNYGKGGNIYNVYIIYIIYIIYIRPVYTLPIFLRMVILVYVIH